MPKLLGEFLQEQQEPFVLDVYLLERGCYTHITQETTRFLRKSACSSGRRRQQGFPSCTDIVRTLFRRLKGRKIKANDRRRREEDHGDEDEFSSARATTLYSSCSGSDVGDDECITKQSSFGHELSPVSVLDETQSQGSPLHKKKYYFKKMQRESSKQATEGHDQYMINKRALQQTKQLLVDCVREVIEDQRRRDDETGQQLIMKKILGAEELWKLVCENVWLWSQDSIDETRIVHLLHCDFMASLEEWSSSCDDDQHKNVIAVEIGDSILEEIVCEIIACC